MTAQTPAGRPVCVVVVNWNGWRDTVSCLASLFAQRGHPIDIVVCDNASTDRSARELGKWLAEQFGAPGPEIDGPGIDGRGVVFQAASPRADGVRSVHLLSLCENFGYAGAINRGIEWGRRNFGARSFWLLNNDVQAEEGALCSLVEARDAVPGSGLCGSVLLEWEQPSVIQAIGGVFNRALAVGWHLRDVPKEPSPHPGVCLAVDYPVGASLFVEQDYLDRVGLMDDSYFLYYEEMDWVERGRRRGFRPVIALKSRLLHKEGASTGSHGGVRHMSLLSERYGVVNRLRITRKLWPRYLPLVWLSLWAVVLERLLHGNLARAALVVRLMWSPHLWLAPPQPAGGGMPKDA